MVNVNTSAREWIGLAHPLIIVVIVAAAAVAATVIIIIIIIIINWLMNKNIYNCSICDAILTCNNNN